MHRQNWPREASIKSHTLASFWSCVPWGTMCSRLLAKLSAGWLSSSVLVEDSMEAYKLSLGGLERFQPVSLGGCSDGRDRTAPKSYVQSVLNAAAPCPDEQGTNGIRSKAASTMIPPAGKVLISWQIWQFPCHRWTVSEPPFWGDRMHYRFGKAACGRKIVP